ncbi:alpha-ketoacid dehydrogenase subunit alpha/beta [Arthrobacter sulfonylureivorans]|uniref:dihydrolipoyllysine-residue succinyltransferase n=1 Tax=Arthrobacter sulfonylureivorans TaxID=2486855 RepID=A0ABY3WF83_9MICC|nr:alpha-ketoacid dehydrogenase subunit alpha/beta [Arthrobacter sulfonylureivorans]UNK47885.1 thiamine pyrophosphate-dependent enzyme [Arthrobacter sulfonylureivorans]
MAFIRRMEERVLELSVEGVISGSVHLCLGQEAIPVGTMAALRDDDRVMATYRGHGWALACGSDPTELLAEIAQRAGGTNGGRAGSPMLSDPEIGFFGENSIVGAGVPIAAGVALAAKRQATDRVVVTSFGEGAMNQGATTEGMNFAAVNRLPVIFVCENNSWAEMTKFSDTTLGDDLVARVEALGIVGREVDGCDPFAVESAVAEAAQLCRDGEGPVFLNCRTTRLKGHYNLDIEHYRPNDDKLAAAAADPIPRLRRTASDEGLLSEEEFAEIDAQIVAEIDAATARVREMPLPDPATVYDDLYGDPPPLAGSDEDADFRELTYQRAANLALKTELTDRPEVVLYGEDVGFPGGIFGVSRGLQKEFGPERVFDTPISESAILGSAVGAAMEGMRPVVEIMWADFFFVALDQVVNHATNVRYINRSKLAAPLTIRTQQGVTPGSSAQHSQSIEALFAHLPGVKVGLASTPQDAYDMLRASIADPDPTILIEARELYQQKAPVKTGGVVQRAEGGRVHREGTDVAIITWGATLERVLEASDQLEAEGIAATVLDLRWLRPLDDAAIAQVVRDCGGRVLVVHEATQTAGFGAEVAARISEKHFNLLASPVSRLATADVRMPSAPNLQEAVLPTAEKIVSQVRDLVNVSSVIAR